MTRSTTFVALLVLAACAADLQAQMAYPYMSGGGARRGGILRGRRVATPTYYSTGSIVISPTIGGTVIGMPGTVIASDGTLLTLPTAGTPTIAGSPIVLGPTTGTRIISGGTIMTGPTMGGTIVTGPTTGGTIVTGPTTTGGTIITGYPGTTGTIIGTPITGYGTTFDGRYARIGRTPYVTGYPMAGGPGTFRRIR